MDRNLHRGMSHSRQIEKCVACEKGISLCSCKPPNLESEVCGKCGNWIRVLGQTCEWDERTCSPSKRK